ncbi:MAG: MBL fold metallo-hydrolase [Candidatus Pacearchaeota archaeon]|nr:MBL fold metallo-hydrolase [Candidatus Pacearchaeota archaeon]
MKISSIELEWLGHAAFKINFKGRSLYIDPYQIQDEAKADIILVTHSHYDHCSQQDIEKLAKDGTIVIATPDCQSKLARLKQKITIELIEPGKEFTINDIKIKAIEAYNPSKKFHPKSEEWVGYIIQCNGAIVYHAGDTDLIKEMSNLTGYGKRGNYFIALLPIGGTYTMNAEEASEAAALIKPTVAIPMHYGTIIGSASDAEKFVKLCEEKGISARILEKS